MILIIDGTRVGDVRIYENGIVQTITARWGMGGGTVPLIFEPKSAFEENWAESEVKNALRANASKSSHVVIETFENNVPNIFPIQDGREMDKKQNGLGIGNQGDPSYTLDRTGAQAVAIQGNMIGRADTAGPQGKGYSEDETMFTLTKTDIHAVAYDEYNNSISDIHHTLRAGTKQSTGVVASIVRRLTPTECERLQGFPDNWTDGQADSHRYQQMGNAVTVNVVEWIGSKL